MDAFLNQPDSGASVLDVSFVLSHMPGGFFVYRADGDEELIYSNESCWRIFGCASKEEFIVLTHNSFPGMVHPEDIDSVQRSIDTQIAASEQNMDYVEYRIRRADGTVRWIEDFGHYVEHEGQGYYYVFINDATEKLQKRLAEMEKVNRELSEALDREVQHRNMLRSALTQAEAANVAKNAFLSNMSHDIRTPLNAVVGFAELIREHGDAAERVALYSDRILEASHELLDVVNETLEITRMEAGNVQLAEVHTSLEEVMNSVAEATAMVAQRRGVVVTIDTSAVRHGRVDADAPRLIQALCQLVDNGIKYSEQGGEVRVTVSEEGPLKDGYGRYRFTVKDRGIGMDADFLEKLYLPFERERTTTMSGVQGTGLGLTIVHHIVHMMGGTIDLKTAPGEGSEFTVVLSLRVLEGDDEPAPVHRSEPRRVAASGRVLLVEDNELNREIACCLLCDAGYEVTTAENGAEAVALVESQSAGTYDMVLMDIQMPVMDGYEATRRIRALGDPRIASLPIIAVSANAFSEDRKRSMEAGMDAHMAKPFDVARLQVILDRLSW